MINFKIGQYLEFENSIAKITKVTKTHVKMRRMTEFQTYDYQQIVKISHLRKLYDEGKLIIIDYLTIMQMLIHVKEEDGGILM